MPIDPQAYGGTAAPEILTFAAPAVDQGMQPSPAGEVPVGAFAYGAAANAQAAAVNAAADRERAGFFASVGAGLMAGDTARSVVSLTRPAFQPERTFNPGEALQHVPMQLTEAEYKFVMESKSQGEWDWAMSQIDDLRTAHTAMGDSPFGAFLGGALDPAYMLAGGVAGAVRGAAAGAIAATAVAATAEFAAAQSTPKEASEVALNLMLNGAAGAFIAKAGKLTPKDPNWPQQELAQAATTPSSAVVSHAEAVATVDKSLAARVGEALQWNVHKTMGSFGEPGKKLANLLFDNNGDLGVTSLEAERVSVRSELTQHQWNYENLVRSALAEDGVGILRTIFNTREAAAKMEELHRQVKLELARREQLSRQGGAVTYNGVSERIKKLADAHQVTVDAAKEEMQRAGVLGADALDERLGYFQRKWDAAKIVDARNALIAAGYDATRADQAVKRLVALSLRRANGWSDELSYDVGSAIINRALRKGYMEDSAFIINPGGGELKLMRDILQSEPGMSPQRIERVLDVLRMKQADAGKEGFMKHRVDLDYRASMLVNGKSMSVLDLIDNNLTTNLEQYLDKVAGQVAFAKKGLKTPGDIEALRAELLHGFNPADPKLRKAADLFDNTIAYMLGKPVGAKMSDGMRAMGAYGRMVALANSGLWQVSEYAVPMAKYGILNSTKHFIKTMPGFSALLNPIPKVGRQLVSVLTGHSEANVRLRPILTRYEDNFEMPVSATTQLRLQQAQQLVPYFNAMKYLHAHQARITANLIVDRVVAAAKGNTKARQALAKYGIESPVMDNIASSIKQHGFDVDKWDDAVWDAARPAMYKMMDESVLHARLGDMPAFAMFDPVGKFILTYRGFVMSAHNKVLAGSLGRDGFSGLGLLMLYQFPLAALATQAQTVLQGKEALDPDALAAKSVGQMGGMGWFGELFAAVSGQKRQFGAPGLIPIDRAYALAGDIAKGDAGNVGKDLSQLVPLAGLLQPVRALGNLATEE